ncbi:MAG: hypothetical protein OXE44_07605 [Nitrospinae bacterium]|nr:hypothetical protein [Nitrospinota bacterium]
MKNRKPSAAAHIIVQAGPALALLYTLLALTGGNNVRFISCAWLLAALWVFLTALSGALWRAYHGARSAFTAYTLPEKDEERFDWETRTGRYSWRRDFEESEMYDDDYPFGHGPIA